MSEYSSPPDLVEYIRNLDQRIAALEAGPRGLWQTPTLENSWTAVIGFAPPGFLADDLGFVHLRGTIQGGGNGATAFILPAGYRPAATIACAGSTSELSKYARIVITPTGAVEPFYEAGKVSLDGVTFLAER